MGPALPDLRRADGTRPGTPRQRPLPPLQPAARRRDRALPGHRGPAREGRRHAHHVPDAALDVRGHPAARATRLTTQRPPPWLREGGAAGGWRGGGRRRRRSARRAPAVDAPDAAPARDPAPDLGRPPAVAADARRGRPPPRPLPARDVLRAVHDDAEPELAARRRGHVGAAGRAERRRVSL